jgi:predicted RNase H-like HicB family nuclease
MFIIEWASSVISASLKAKTMTRKLLLPFLAITLVYSGYTGVEARQSRRVTPIKPATTKVVAPAWKLYTAPDGRFSVLMPGIPKRLTQTQKTFMGEINLELFVGQPPNQEVAYVVAFNDFPDSYGQMATAEEVLSNAQAMALKTTQSNLVSERDIRSSNGHPGKEIEYINGGGKLTKNRMYFAEGRLYQVMVITTRKQQKYLTKSIAGYLNSFNVVLKK